MFDTEKFICEIEARAPLYDVKSKSYSNREIKAKCWFEVGNAMFDDWDEIELAEKDERGKCIQDKITVHKSKIVLYCVMLNSTIYDSVHSDKLYLLINLYLSIC